MNYLKRLWCAVFGHDFRRARKGQDARFTYCRRCAVTRAITRRVKLKAVA